MRAAMLWETGSALEVEDVELLAVGPGEVRVEMACSGVCHSDLSIRDGVVNIGLLPGVLGHEGAGVVAEIGEGVSDLAVGDHVILSWITPCGRCRWCVVGQSFRCPIAFASVPRPRFKVRGEDAYGLVGLATFAEQSVVPAAAAIKIDADVPLRAAALIGCAVMTGVGSALNVARVEPGSSVVVVGCGGVGISAIQGARIAGAAEILAVDRNPDKLSLARRFGASHGATPDELPDVVREVTGGEGFDYGFEALGRRETVAMTWGATRPGGQAVIIGIGGPDMMSGIPAAELGTKAVVNSLYGGAEVRRDFHRLIRLWRTGRLDLEGMITRVIDLTEVNSAFDAMERGEGIRTVIEY